MSAPIMEPPPPTPEQLAAWAEADRQLDAAAAGGSAAAAAAGSAPAPAALKRRSGLLAALAVPFVMFVCLAGPVASAVYFWSKPLPPKEKPDAAPPAPEPLALDAVDELIRAGAYVEALATCRRPGPELPAPKARARAYREALCLEALGRLKEADEMYHKAGPEEGDRAAWARATLGRARCALASDDLAAAQRHLDRVVARSGHPDCAGTKVVEECAFLRARLTAARLGPVRAMDPLDSEAVAWPGLGGAQDLYFDWLPPDTLPATSVGVPEGPSVFEARRAPNAPGGFEVTAHAAERPVTDTVRACADAAGLKLLTDPTAVAALAPEVSAIDVQGAALGDVLSALLGKSGVGWKVEGEALILAPAPVDAPTREQAEAALRRALASAPAHPRATAVKVWLANFDFVAGRNREAAKEYQQLLEAVPPLPEAPHAAYNLGLAELRTGALASARSRFVDLGDRAPRSKWAEYGWWWAGRTNLDTGDTDAARKAFRSAAGGKTREVASAVALGLCACELLDGNDAAAREALEASRSVPRERHMALWGAFEGLLRYRAQPSDGRRTSLLTTMREASDGRALGPCGVYLAGRVYRDLGMPDTMLVLYDQSTESIRGPLAVRMTFDAAAWYDLSERFEPARARYRAVAAADPKGLGPQADLRLAALALRTGDPDECLRRCRGLLGRPGADRAEVLSLMGKGYELKRNYRFAAECFAGRVPPE
jgi:tetratricopeptide (TPR) repeat protein